MQISCDPPTAAAATVHFDVGVTARGVPPGTTVTLTLEQVSLTTGGGWHSSVNVVALAAPGAPDASASFTFHVAIATRGRVFFAATARTAADFAHCVTHVDIT